MGMDEVNSTSDKIVMSAEGGGKKREKMRNRKTGKLKMNVSEDKQTNNAKRCYRPKTFLIRKLEGKYQSGRLR
jgi:hypothetical protein